MNCRRLLSLVNYCIPPSTTTHMQQPRACIIRIDTNTSPHNVAVLHHRYCFSGVFSCNLNTIQSCSLNLCSSRQIPSIVPCCAPVSHLCQLRLRMLRPASKTKEKKSIMLSLSHHASHRNDNADRMILS